MSHARATQPSNKETKEEPEPVRTFEDGEAGFLKILLKRIEEFEIDEKKLRKEKEELEKEKLLRSQVRGKLKHSPVVVSSAMAIIGVVFLIFSVISASTIFAYIGLGLTFWGSLLLFIRPQKYVRSDLLDSTALSSLKTIDRTITELGYCQKGIYIPVNNTEKVVVFIPSEPLTSIPKAAEIKNQIFINSPKGIVIVPPGIGLANLIESKLGDKFRKNSLETLRGRLPKLLIEDLEIFQDFEMQLDGNNVNIKFAESIYSELCMKLRDNTKICSLFGCPICSAMACILARVSGKPVSFENDTYSPDGRMTESSYHIFEG